MEIPFLPVAVNQTFCNAFFPEPVIVEILAIPGKFQEASWTPVDKPLIEAFKRRRNCCTWKTAKIDGPRFRLKVWLQI